MLAVRCAGSRGSRACATPSRCDASSALRRLSRLACVHHSFAVQYLQCAALPIGVFYLHACSSAGSASCGCASYLFFNCLVSERAPACKQFLACAVALMPRYSGLCLVFATNTRAKSVILRTHASAWPYFLPLRLASSRVKAYGSSIWPRCMSPFVTAAARASPVNSSVCLHTTNARLSVLVLLIITPRVSARQGVRVVNLAALSSAVRHGCTPPFATAAALASPVNSLWLRANEYSSSMLQLRRLTFKGSACLYARDLVTDRVLCSPHAESCQRALSVFPPC